jgi:cytochrome c-type biogenesis protein CcmH
MTRRWAGVALAAFLAAAGAARAVEPGERLDDPALEGRARGISQGLRCLVCQNQSIDDSSAPLAADLRVLVRQRLQAGDSDAAVRDFVVARYGDFVLLKPPFKPATYALWLGPAAALALAAGGVALAWRRRRAKAESAGEAPLSEAERRRASALLE